MTLEEKVLEVLKETFRLDAADTSCSQNNCPKWDSMGQLNLVFELESRFNVSLEPEEIGVMLCFDDIVRTLRSKGVE